MTEATTVDTRHGVIADDSVRTCTIIPRTIHEEIRGLRGKSRPTVSAVVRECIILGLDKLRKQNGE